MTFTKNLMAWLPLGAGEDTRILHLKPAGESYYRPYTAYKHLAKPDYKVEGGSRGYATMQALLKQGWELESCEVAATQKFLVFGEKDFSKEQSA